LEKVGLVLDVPGAELVPLGSPSAVVEGSDPLVDVPGGEAGPVDGPESGALVVLGAGPVAEVLGFSVTEVPGLVAVVGAPSDVTVP
jgi:hypothetical protein